MALLKVLQKGVRTVEREASAATAATILAFRTQSARQITDSIGRRN